MSKQANLLPQVRVASPCTASWNEMEGDDRARFCGECKLNVYNLSDMTSTEAEAFLREATGRTCVRYFQRADGKVLTRDCPRGLAAARKRFAAGLATAGVVTLAVAFAVIDGLRGSRTTNGSRRMAELQERLEAVPAFAAILDKIDPSRTTLAVAGGMRITWAPATFHKAPPPPTTAKAKPASAKAQSKKASPGQKTKPPISP